MPDEAGRHEARIPLELQYKFDVICDRFEAACRQGDDVRLEAFLDAVEPPYQALLFDELLAIEFHTRQRKGASIDADAYRDRFPQYAEIVDEALEANATTSSGYPSPEAGQGFDGLPCPFGRYHLLEVISRGGMGVVYRARQHGLERDVAVKMILPELTARVEAVRRFRNEARAAARLSHPGIVPIYDVGCEDGRHYFSMEFVEGPTLDELIRGTAITSERAAHLAKELSEAIAYAHERGIVHRDLKPSNVLLDHAGKARITDFGLAKLRGRQALLTVADQLLGTPSFMSPELAQGNAAEATEATDIYSLGAILYALLSGRPPFRGSSAVDTIRQVVQQDPVRPRDFNASIPRDLETICLKCLEKAPGHRYRTAQALADDLGRFLRQEPIAARPVSRWGRAVRWCRRNPTTAALLTAVALLLVGVATATTIGYRREAAARRDAETNLYYSRITDALLNYRSNSIAQARESLAACVPGPNEVDLRACEWHILAGFLNSPRQRLQANHTEQTPWVEALAFGPDDRWLATGTRVPRYVNARHDAPCALRIWETATGELLLDERTSSISSLAFSDDGTWLAFTTRSYAFDLSATNEPGSVEVWKLTPSNGKVRVAERFVVAHQIDSPRDVGFVGDGRMVACRVKGGARAWELHTAVPTDVTGDMADSLPHGIEMNSPPPPQRISRSGRFRARVVREQLLIERVKGNAFLYALAGNTADILDYRFSPDETCVATAGADTAVRMWDLTTGELHYEYRGHTAQVNAIAFSTTGRFLASADTLGMVCLWDTTRHPEYATFSAPELQLGDRIEAIAIDPLKRDLLGVQFVNDRPGRTSQLLRWGLADRTLRARIMAPLIREEPWYYGTKAAFDARGSKFAAVAADGDGTVAAVFDAASGQRLSRWKPSSLPIQTLAFSADGKLAATASWTSGNSFDGTHVAVWNASSGDVTYKLHYANQRVFRLVFGPRADELAISLVREEGQPDKRRGTSRVEVRELPDGRLRYVLPERRSVAFGVAFSPSSTYLATASFYEATDEATVEVWDAAAGTKLRDAEPHAHVECLTFHPTQERLAGASRENVALWDTSTGHKLLVLRGKRRVGDHIFHPQVTFSQDGSLLAANQWDQTVNVWRAANRE